MMWGYYGGAGWVVMIVTSLLLWGGVIVLALWAVRALAEPRHRSDHALDILRERLARGEITQEQFENTKRTIQG